jgi:Sec-independent protein translocase protein TatA
MDFFGIGIQELLLLVLIALIVLGPKDMAKFGRAIGKVLRKTIFSPTWMNVQRTVRNLPYQLAREAGLEEMELKKDLQSIQSDIQQSMSSMQEEVRRDLESVDSDLQQAKVDQAAREYMQEVQQASRQNEIPAEWISPPNGSSENKILPPQNAPASGEAPAEAASATAE